MSTFLQFSGGKDSLACLHLLKPRWNEITVAWLNTGAAFPETIALMQEIRSQVPHFVEIAGQQNLQEHGHPVDVVPINSTTLGQFLGGAQGMRFQSRYDCCMAAIWRPMHSAMKELGATTVIRGQRRSDAKKSPMLSGQIVDGITYEFPLEDWTEADVFRYLTEKGVSLPRNYQHMRSGLDCLNCTAYLDEEGRMDYLRAHHPLTYQHVQGVLQELSNTLNLALQPLRESV